MQELSPKQQLLARSFAERLALDTYLQGFPSNWSFDQVISALIDETGDVSVWPQFEDMTPSDVARQIADLVPDFESNHRTLLEANNAQMFGLEGGSCIDSCINIQSFGEQNHRATIWETPDEFNGEIAMSSDIKPTKAEAITNLKLMLKKFLLG